MSAAPDGGPRRFWTNRDDAQLIELAGQGMTEAAIAQRLGRTRFSVQARKALLRRQGRLAASRAPRRVPADE